MTAGTIRVAVDLMGGDRGPRAVAAGALRAVTDLAGVEVTLVGPAGLAHELADGRAAVVSASEVVAMDEDPAAAVRAKRDASVRVAARLVRDGKADAMVGVGSTGAVLAAAVFTLGRLAGATRCPLAVVVPTDHGPLVLLDAGAVLDCSADVLGQFALAGTAYAATWLGIASPRVGLLNIGTEAGKGDALRKDAYALLGALPVDFVGNVEGRDVVRGGVADVVVTDGFTGNVLLKGLEAMADGGAGRRARHRGGLLLGVDGVVVVGHGDADADAVTECIDLAAGVVRAGLVPRVGAAVAQQVAARRAAAGSSA